MILDDVFVGSRIVIFGSFAKRFYRWVSNRGIKMRNEGQETRVESPRFIYGVRRRQNFESGWRQENREMLTPGGADFRGGDAMREGPVQYTYLLADISWFINM